MRTEAALLGAAALVAFSVPANAARLTGWYGVFEGGGTYIHDVEVATYIPPAAPLVSTMAAEYGVAGLAGLGYAYDNGWRVELEGGYRANDFDGSDASLNEWSVLANVLYDIEVTNRLRLSLGAGAGGGLGLLQRDVGEGGGGGDRHHGDEGFHRSNLSSAL